MGGSMLPFLQGTQKSITSRPRPGIMNRKNMYAWMIILSFASFAGVQTAKACACEAATSACREVTSGSTVFIGTVESISPRFLDHWSRTRRPSLTEIIDSDSRFLADGSRQNFEALKNEIRKKMPDLPPGFQERLSAATTHDAVVGIFEDVLRRGRIVRFQMKTLFNRGGEDDDADDNDPDGNDGSPASIEISTPFGDCGYNFQQGETYLVYAVSDEDTTVLVADACTATKRLSDAGADLPYLYFVKDNKRAAGRLEGVATYDPHVLLDPPAEDENPASPAIGLVIEASSGESHRYAISDKRGRFVFDGLAPGDYTVSAWGPGYPDTLKLLSDPSEIPIGPKSCANKILLIRPR
jgi:hypothetical protein